jgi:hypothetical protein
MKLRSLEMVRAMDVADDLLERLSPLVDDPDVAVRTEVVTVLGSCSRFEALQFLYQAEEDASPSVREAANRSIEQVAERSADSAGSNLPLTGDFY